MIKQVLLNNLSLEIALAETRESLTILHFADTYLCECDDRRFSLAQD